MCFIVSPYAFIYRPSLTVPILGQSNDRSGRIGLTDGSRYYVLGINKALVPFYRMNLNHNINVTVLVGAPGQTDILRVET